MIVRAIFPYPNAKAAVSDVVRGCVSMRRKPEFFGKCLVPHETMTPGFRKPVDNVKGYVKSNMEQSPQIGDRITDKSSPPDDRTISDWMGPKGFKHWTDLRRWIEAYYPGVFVPDWIYGGKKRGWSLRYKKTKAFCTLLPEYGQLSVLVVFGGVERQKFEERRPAWRAQLVKLYDEAKTYPDGKWLTLAVSTADDWRDIAALLTMKRPPRTGE